MFGSRLKTWMENYIGLPKKKEVQKEKPKGNHRGGVILESSESLALSDTGISSSSQQVLSSSTTDNREAYSTTTMESERSGMTHCHTAISLPSPESAYSTGYSTDGASPGATGPPEYYINIRTGKHYFPSPAPTPTSPQPNPAFLQLLSTNQCVSTSFFRKDPCLPSRLALLSETVPSPRAKDVQTSSPLCNGFSPRLDSFVPEMRNSPRRKSILSTSVPSHFEIFSFSKSPSKKSSAKSQLTSLKLFLKSPKQDKGKPKPDFNKTPSLESKKKLISNGKPKKWFKQPFQKFGHRRMDSCGESLSRNEVKREIHFEKNFGYLLGQENSVSPRQRNRIKTNPWLPTEPMSSQNFNNLKIEFSPSLTRNRSCSNTPLQNRKTNQIDSLQSQIKQLNMKYEESKEYLNNLERTVNRHVGRKLVMELSDHSEDDLTLNEMMGTYNESYVYEKETDILSDSDPTDCEDYGTDSEADNGGDERDSHDELDFIDNGSVTESDDNVPRNTGKCVYYDVHFKKNSFLYKSDRHQFRRDSEWRKNSRKNADSKLRREKRKHMRRSFKQEDEERQNAAEGKMRPKVEIDENVGGLNLSRVLVQRMMAKQVSKSAEGTPVTARRRKIPGTPRELRETHIGNEKAEANEKKADAVSDAILRDVEADNKYKELIKEAENIFETLRNSPVIKSRKKVSLTDDKDGKSYKTEQNVESLDIWKKAATTFCPRGEPTPKKPETPVRKSPKNLGLKLSVDTPKKLQRLDFEANKQSSFKARSSAHSPLDPLGPTLKNFSVFKPAACDERKISTSSSEDFESTKTFETKGREKMWDAVPGSPIVPIAFQSVDLGKPLTSYCPQSEPVKRKIYSCSKTYDKLVKQFENKPTIFEENIDGVKRISLASSGCKSAACRGLQTCLNGKQGSFPQDERIDGEKLLRGEVLGYSQLGYRSSSIPGDPPGPEHTQNQPIHVDVFR